MRRRSDAPMARWGQVWGAAAAVLVVAVVAACNGSTKNTGNRPKSPDLVIATAQAAAATAQPASQSPRPTPSTTATSSPTATPIPTPSPTPTASPTPTPAPHIETLADGTHGYVVSSTAAVHAEPRNGSATVSPLRYEQQLTLKAKVRGENVVVGDQTWYIASQDWQNLWYQVDGGYVYSAYVWVPRQGEILPSQLQAGERWVDVNLATLTARAMIGGTAVYTASVTSGKDGYETPTGHWHVQYQVLNETMTSGQAGINDPAEHYDVHNVLYTQYFDGSGDALHLNYWQPDGVFGSTRTSHGCVGLYIRDAQYLWMFGQSGMRVEITVNGKILPPPNPPARTSTPTPSAGRTPAARPSPPPMDTPVPTATSRPAPPRSPTATPNVYLDVRPPR